MTTILVDESTGEITGRLSGPQFPGGPDYPDQMMLMPHMGKPLPPPGAWYQPGRPSARSFSDYVRYEVNKREKPFTPDYEVLHALAPRLWPPVAPSTVPSVLARNGAQDAAHAARAKHAGLVKSAISDRVRSYQKTPVTVEIYADLLKVRVRSYPRPDERKDSRPLMGEAREKAKELQYQFDERAGMLLDAPPVKRGKVVGFSRRSRKRLLEAVAMARGLERGYFLTLTLPDSIVTALGADSVALAHEIKRFERMWRKRLLRAFPKAFGWWRMEFQDRKSGPHLGVVVPHIHLLLFGPIKVKMKVFRRWLSLSWYQVVRSRDAKHERAGTNVTRLHDRRHAVNYTAKYQAKVSDDELDAGRRWGQFGGIDNRPVDSLDITLDEWAKMKRLIVGWMKGRGSKRRQWRRIQRRAKHLGASIFGLGDPTPRGQRINNNCPVQRMLTFALGDTPKPVNFVNS